MRIYAIGLAFFTIASIPQAAFAQDPGTVSRSQNPCILDFIEAKIGDAVQDLTALPFQVPKKTRVHVLSDGGLSHRGSRVYRVELPGGETRIYKYCKDAKLAAEDFEKLKVLYEVSKEPGYEGFQVIKPTLVKGKLLVLADQRGETLTAVSFVAGPRMKRRLEDQYVRKLTQTFKALKKRIPELRQDSTNPMIFHYDLQDGIYRKSFYLHEENILVNLPSDEMTIIDPE